MFLPVTVTFNSVVVPTNPVAEDEAIWRDDGFCPGVPLLVDRQRLTTICVVEDGSKWQRRSEGEQSLLSLCEAVR